MQGVYVSDQTWKEVQAALNAGMTAVLPVGAEAKEHGLHLPMNTDLLQAKWLTDRLIERYPVAVWPVISYGFYPAFVDYPGSCSLSRETFLDMVEQILNSILSAGAERVVVMNTGISTINPIEAAIGRCNWPAKVALANIYQGSRYASVMQGCTEQIRGGHADEVETSIMLVCAPHQVQMDKAEAQIKPMYKGPFNRNDSDGLNYSPSGVYGDPRLASLEKGEVLLDAIFRDISQFFEQQTS